MPRPPLPVLIGVALAALFAAPALAQDMLPLTPVIGLSPAQLDFDPCLDPGQCQQLSFELFNDVNDPQSILEITAVDLAAAQFAMIDGPPAPLSIPGDGTRVLYTVLFCPNGYPAAGVVIVLAQNAPNSPSLVRLSGDGDFPPVCDAGGPYHAIRGAPLTLSGRGSIDPDTGPGIVSYRWDFGDGTTGTGVEVQHIYTATGTYVVELEIEDACRNTATCSTTVEVGLGNAFPVCDAGGPYSGLINEFIQFDGTGSYDPDGVITAYRWDFGDGRTGFGPTPTHAYTVPGIYSVVLRVTDNQNAASTCFTHAEVFAVNVPPICDAGGPYLSRVGLSIRFDGSGSSDPDGFIARYDWQFGDGTTGNGTMPTHAYTAPGTYVVELCVTDDRGDQTCCETQAEILSGSTPLTPVIGVTPEVLDFGGCVLVGESRDLDIAIYNDIFDPESILDLTGITVEGEGYSLAGGPPPPVALPGDGTSRATYTVRFAPSGAEPQIGSLTLTAPGATNTPRVVPLTGAGNFAPICDAGGPYPGVTGTPIQFNGTASSDPEGAIVLYHWSFGDGATATGPTPTHTYTVHGTYTVTLTLTDACGVMTSCTATAEILATPVCDAGGPYYGVPGIPVQFDGTGSHDPDGTIVLYLWDFGDGSTGTGPTPVHNYPDPSSYDVTLAVTDNDGFTSECLTFVDTGAVPVASVDSLAAAVRDRSVELTWMARQAGDLLGFAIRRGSLSQGEPPGPLPDLVFDLDGDGHFRFVDRDVAAAQRYLYQLIAVARDGEREQVAEILVTVPALSLALHAPHPNPTERAVAFGCDLPRPGHARVRIIDASGRVVVTLLDRGLGAGSYPLAWNGLDAAGRPAPAGVYFVALEMGVDRRWQKIVLSP